MAQFIVRQLEESLKVRLKLRAERHGRSVEAEIREILRNAASETTRSSLKLGSRIAARFKGTGLPVELPELRGSRPQAAELGR